MKLEFLVEEVSLNDIREVDSNVELLELDMPSLCLRVSLFNLSTCILGVFDDNEYHIMQHPSSSKSFDSFAYDIVGPRFEEWATEHYQSINN